MLKLGRVLRLFLVVCLSTPFLAQEAAKTAKPEPAKQSYAYEDLTDKASFENDGTGLEEITARVKISSEAGLQQWGVVKFSYQDLVGSIEILYVRVRKPDGT